ncbi:MAG: SusC/RagA family TonB-linked outer membrane protein [Saprospiraceae bacterium]
MKLKVYFLRGLMLLFFAVGLTSLASAQRTITGTITDAETNEPLIGASVLVTNTSSGTVTDLDGNYSVNFPASATQLTISYTGYTTQTVDVGTSSVVDATLSSGETLGEVVVIGYGTTTQEQVTSAVTSVKAEDFNVGNVNNPTALIQGKVAGLSISQVGGNPNSTPTIRLRGLSTFGGNAQPLVIIDGVVGANLQTVDPADIESIDVLKDGSAAAIYGIQASSGVIIVTTKSGKAGVSRLSYRTYVTAESVAKSPEVASASEYLRLVRATAGDTIAMDNDYGAETDWVDELTRTGISHAHNLSYTGGAGGTTYRASANYRDIQGIGVVNDGFRQLNGRLSVTQKAVNDRLTLQADVTATDRQADFFNADAFRYAVTYNPTVPVRVDGDNAGGVPDGIRRNSLANFGGFFEVDNFDYFNPVAIARTTDSTGQTSNLLYSFRGTFDLTDDLKISAFYARNRETNSFSSFASRESFYDGNAAGALNLRGSAGRAERDSRNDLIEVTAIFNRDLGNVGMELLGGYSWQEYNFSGFRVNGRGLPSDAFNANNLGSLTDLITGQIDIASYQDAYRIIGFFGRARFDIDNTYFLSASLRRDGTTRNAPGEKWGLFPAVSASVDLVKAVGIAGADRLKLRAGYGITGSIPNSNLGFLQLSNVGQQFPINGVSLTTIGPTTNGNPNLGFEKKGEFNAGLDFAFADYRLVGSLDFYTRRTRDLLLNVQVPTPSELFGSTEANLNNVELVNTGLELAIGYNVGDAASGFSWNPNFVFSTFNTKLEDNGDEPDFNFGSGGREIFASSSPGSPGQNDDPLVQVAIGEDIGGIYTRQADLEASREAGEWVYIDQDGDGDVDNDDRVLVGNGLPDFSIGFQNQFTLGANVDFSFFLRGDFGHDLANLPQNFYGQQGNLTTRAIDNLIVNDRFQEGILGAPQFSDYFVEDASFVVLDNAQIGYTLRLGEGSSIRDIRFYVAGQNLFYITGYSGVDPNVRYGDRGPDPAPDTPTNVLVNGLDRRNTYFRTRSFTFGANVNF